MYCGLTVLCNSSSIRSVIESVLWCFLACKYTLSTLWSWFSAFKDKLSIYKVDRLHVIELLRWQIIVWPSYYIMVACSFIERMNRLLWSPTSLAKGEFYSWRVYVFQSIVFLWVLSYFSSTGKGRCWNKYKMHMFQCTKRWISCIGQAIERIVLLLWYFLLVKNTYQGSQGSSVMLSEIHCLFIS